MDVMKNLEIWWELNTRRVARQRRQAPDAAGRGLEEGRCDCELA